MSLLSFVREASLREKTAWTMTLILTVTAAFYFYDVVNTSRTLGDTAPPNMGFILAYVIVTVSATVAIMGMLAGSSAKEADAPADEREQRIEDKAGHWSGYVLAVPAIGALFHYCVNPDGNLLFHLLFLSFMLSSIAEYAFQIILFRRGL